MRNAFFPHRILVYKESEEAFQMKTILIREDQTYFVKYFV